jgi:UPF0176 protein
MVKNRNILNKEDCLAAVRAEPFSRTSISFYRYVKIADPVAFREKLWDTWSELGVLGRIYLAKEGVNAQLSIPKPKMAEFRASVDSFPEFKDVQFKVGLQEDIISFWKLTIKARKYILADGIKEAFDVTNVGDHLTAKQFNEAMDEGATVVDMRNAYESEIGRFDGAICPDVETFQEELPVALEALKGKEDERVLLYCTGGIRCEKASAYLKHHGFNDVAQLHGGIIDYKHQVERDGLESKFKGKNFVFDGRMTETVTDDVFGKCLQCKEPANTPVNCKNDACHALFLQCASCNEKLEGTCKEECQRIAGLPIEEQRELRRGLKVGRNVLM